MAIPLYLAMTAAEFRRAAALPQHMAWLSCLFSPYSTGLSNIPKQLPKESLLILSDLTPIYGHDPQLIKAQLEDTANRLHCCGILLDFQRPDADTAQIVKAVSTLSCPVAVSQMYAQEVDCPVFLPPVPIDVCLEDHLAPWEGREIWLEAAFQGKSITVTEKGSSAVDLPCSNQQEGIFFDDVLFCHYNIQTDHAAHFTLWRTREDLSKLLEKASALGVTRAVGLYQELGNT